jgi:hypothetical protein
MPLKTFALNFKSLGRPRIFEENFFFAHLEINNLGSASFACVISNLSIS